MGDRIVAVVPPALGLGGGEVRVVVDGPHGCGHEGHPLVHLQEGERLNAVLVHVAWFPRHLAGAVEGDGVAAVRLLGVAAAEEVMPVVGTGIGVGVAVGRDAVEDVAALFGLGVEVDDSAGLAVLVGGLADLHLVVLDLAFVDEPGLLGVVVTTAPAEDAESQDAEQAQGQDGLDAQHASSSVKGRSSRYYFSRLF